MTKTEFAILVDEVLNECDCRLTELTYFDDGICEIRYSDEVFEKHFYVAYKFMNRAKLRLVIMDGEDLLIPIDPELDLGF